MDRTMIADATTILGATGLPLLQLIGIELELEDWTTMKVKHWARMNLKTLDEARTFADSLILLNDGVPALADGTGGLPGLDLLGSATPSRSAMGHKLLDLCQHTASDGLGRGGISDALADSMLALTEGKDGGKSRVLRRLPDGDARALMSVAWAGGLHKAELLNARPGVKAVSDGAHYTSYNDASGKREPRFPSYDDMPFDELVSETNRRIYDPAQGRSEAVRDAFIAMLVALEAAAQRVTLPALFADTVAPGAFLSTGVGVASLRRSLLMDTQYCSAAVLRTELKALQDKMSLWAQGESWEKTMYPRAIEFVSRIEERVDTGLVNKTVDTAGAVDAPAKAKKELAAVTTDGSAATTKLEKALQNEQKEKDDLRRQLNQAGIFSRGQRRRGEHLNQPQGGRGRGGRGGYQQRQQHQDQQQQPANNQYHPYVYQPPYQQQYQQQPAVPQPRPPAGPPPGAPGYNQFAQGGGSAKCRDFERGTCTRGTACRFAH